MSIHNRRGFSILAAMLCIVLPIDAQLPSLDVERAKNLGIAYLEQEQPKDALVMFQEVIALVPEEPLGYANLAVSHLRLSQVDSALYWLGEAHSVAPEDTHVLYLMSEANSAANRWEDALQALDQAVKLSPDDPIVRYARYRASQSARSDARDATAAEDMERLVVLVPDNPAIRMKYAKDRAASGDFESARESFAAVKSLLDDAGVQERVLALVEKGLVSGNSMLAARGFTVLENVLRPSERYKQALESLQNPVVGLPVLRFSDRFHKTLRREVPAEISVEWVGGEETYPLGGSGRHGSLNFADVNDDGIEDWVASIDGDQGGSRLFLSDGSRHTNGWSGPAAREIYILDFDNDGAFDLLSIGQTGTRMVRGDSTGSLTDVTAGTEIVSGDVNTVAIVDMDNEGDLDLALGASDGFYVWQNRMDGRFREVSDRIGIDDLPGIRSVISVDHDDDDDPDLVAIDGSGRLRLFDNLRLGRFAEVDRGFGESVYRSVASVDADNDGWMDLVTVTESGALAVRYWRVDQFASDVVIDEGPFSQVSPGDYDNDGWTDVAVSRDGELAVYRNDGQGGWVYREIAGSGGNAVAIGWSDIENDGDLDLIALRQDGTIETVRNDGGNANHWLRLGLVGLQTRGTKNNLNGYGSRVEVKAGFHYQLQYVDRPVMHFGLGQLTQADLVRVTWSNGVPQNAFRPEANQTLREKQVLKGSCPYLYVWDGERYRFVTDLLGAAPLGLQLADGVIASDNPREIVKIDSDLMAEQDGEYVFQFTEELWETIYLDEVGLWVVDHPEGVEAFTDERFVPPPYSDPEVVTTRGRRYPMTALNTNGEDVAERLSAYDYRYPNVLKPTRYQGLVEPHTLTMAFGDVSDLANPTLVMRGWIFWTDTSINVNVSQGEAVKPDFPMIDVWRAGAWVTLDRPFGLPKGKDKWMVLDLEDQIDPADARVRIRTNYQIYYDLAFLADAVAERGTRVTRLKPVSADLHYGGFSEMVRPSPEGPHLYNYAKKVSLPVWKDMTGLVTRFGDVTNLVNATDDLMTVFTAGEEITIRFDASALPELPIGMTRSFFFLSDGWDKDSDRNTVTGDTVLPLPFHAMTAYPYPEGETFPDTEAHRRMIRETLTRRIGPAAYRDYVRSKTFTQRPEPLPWENTKDIAEGGME